MPGGAAAVVGLTQRRSTQRAARDGSPPAWCGDPLVYPVTATADVPPQPASASREAVCVAGLVRHVMAVCRVVARVGLAGARLSASATPHPREGDSPVRRAAIRVLISLWRQFHKSLKSLHTTTPQTRC